MNGLAVVFGAVLLISIRHTPQLILDFAHRRFAKSQILFDKRCIALMGAIWAVITLAALECLRTAPAVRLSPRHTVIALIFGSGIGLGILGLRQMRNFYTETLVIPVGSRLITCGVYSIVRHPMRLGLALESLAGAMLIAAWWAYLLWVFLIMIQLLRTNKEEKLLLSHFGSEARTYFNEVPRFNIIIGILGMLYASMKRMNERNSLA